MDHLALHADNFEIKKESALRKSNSSSLQR